MKSSLADLIGSGTGCHTVQVKGHRCCGFQRVSMEPVSHGERIPEREERCYYQFPFISIFDFKDILFAVVRSPQNIQCKIWT